MTLPLDVQAAEIDENKLDGYTPEAVSSSSCTIEVQKTLEILSNSKRPVVLAGNGIRLSGAKELFLKVIESEKFLCLAWKASTCYRKTTQVFLAAREL